MTDVLTYEALKAERDQLADLVNALAVRNEQLTSCVIEGFNIAGQGGSWCGGDIQELGEKLGLFARETYQPVLHGYQCGHEPGEDSIYVITKSPTSIAPVELRAQGVEMFADFLGKKYQCEKGATARAKALKHIVFLSCRFANELREGK